MEVLAREEGWFKRCRDHGHVISKNNVEVLAREEGWFKRCRDHGHVISKNNVVHQ